MEDGKICVVCGEFKTLDSFYKRADAKDGLRGECKTCKLAWQAKWKKEHPERAKETAKRGSATWRKRNPELVKAYSRSETAKQAVKRWAIEHPEKMKVYRDRHYYESNGRKANLRRNAKRRARLAGSYGEPYTLEDVIELYGSICYLCGNEIDLNAPRWTKHEGWQNGLHIDHIKPIALGGPDIIENVRPTHGICNIKKGCDVNAGTVIQSDR